MVCLTEYGGLFIIPARPNQDFVESFFSTQQQMCGGTQNMTAYVHAYSINGYSCFQTAKALGKKKTNVYELKETLSYFNGECKLHTYKLSCLKCVSHASAPFLTLTRLKAKILCLIEIFMPACTHNIHDTTSNHHISTMALKKDILKANNAQILWIPDEIQ